VRARLRSATGLGAKTTLGNMPTVQTKERSDVTPGTTAYAVEHESAGVWSAVRSNIALVVIIVLLFTAAGVVAALHRQPKYTAAARLAVLHLNFGSPGALAAFQSAAPMLSDTYSRSIDADGVVRPLAVEFHTSVNTIRSELGATAVPTSPLFMVTATTLSPTASIALANAAMQQLVTYLQRANEANADAPRLYAELKKVEASLAAAQNKETAVRENINNAMARSKAVSMSPAQQAQLSAAQSTVNITAANESALRSDYDQSLLNGSFTQYLQPLQSATTTTSDRSSKLELFAFIGLALGIAVGTAVAVARRARALRKLRTA
jgi:capsular polysaccharide biosynthesis protein